MPRAFFVLCAAFMITGCAAPGSAPESSSAASAPETAPSVAAEASEVPPTYVRFRGESNADLGLKRNVLQVLTQFTEQEGCDSISAVDAQVLHHEPRTGDIDHVWGEEAWNVSGCGQVFPFVLTFSEDGGSGNLFRVKQG